MSHSHSHSHDGVPCNHDHGHEEQGLPEKVDCCVVCDAPNSKFGCDNCKSVKYCDAQCKQLHWRDEHEKRCDGPASKNECASCQEELISPLKLICSHSICVGCVEKMSNTPGLRKCPICNCSSFGYFVTGGIDFARGCAALGRGSYCLANNMSEKAGMNYKESVYHFSHALQTHPDSSIIYCNIGVALVSLSQFDQAAYALKKAIELDAGDSKAHYMLGMVRIFANHPEAAVGELEAAVRCLSERPVDPEHADNQDADILSDYKELLERARNFEYPKLRFDKGSKVECRCSSGWVKGRIVSLWYREEDWSPEQSTAPYQIELDDGGMIFAPYDVEQIIRASN